MANSFNRAHKLSDDGLIIENGAHFISGVATPQGAINPTNPTYYHQTNGVIWYHSGVGGISAWIALPLKQRVTVAQASTVVAFANITQLVTPILPVGSYKFNAQIKIRSAATATGYGLRFQNGTATVSDILAQWRLPANADFSTTHNIIYSQRDLVTNNFAGTVAAANTDYCAIGEGMFTLSVAGTVAIQVRSETAGTAVTVGINSNLFVEPLI